MAKNKMVELDLDIHFNAAVLEQAINRAMRDGAERASRIIEDWVSHEVSNALQIEMRKALKSVVRAEIGKYVKK